MTVDDHSEEISLQGTRIELDPDQLDAAIEAVVDYRGDVTLEMKDGTEHVGYVSNCARRSPLCFDLFPADGGAPVAVPVDDVTAIAFSGRDTASGRSWEAWVKRWNEKKQAEAEGRDIGDIEPKPEAL